jgi:hypothetical protein
MNVSCMNMWRRSCARFFSLLSIYFLSSSLAFAASASLSTSTVNIDVGQNGSWTISGNDDGNEREFRWSLPSGLSISTGSSSNLNRFRVRSDRGYFQVETDGRGSFSGTVNVSASSAGTYVMQNTRQEISLSPDNITVNVGGSGGGGSTPPPTEPPPPTGDGGSGSGTADYTLYIDTGSVSLSASPDSGNGATTIPIWGFTDVNGGNSSFPGPVLESVEGGSFTVEVVNNLNRNHNFVIQGVTSDSTAIAPGGSRTYTVNTPNAGIYRYSDTLDNNVNRAVGMFGALVVRTADGSQRVWTNGPRYDQERTWVINDLDRPRWTNVALGGGSVNTNVYRPNYFFMNGQNGFAGMADSNSTLEGVVGDTFIVRIVNAGQYDQSLHFHSNHFQVLSRGGNRENAPPWQDTINVKANSTAMVLYQLNQPGHYPMHVHTAQMETGNGVYLNGTATMIIAH